MIDFRKILVKYDTPVPRYTSYPTAPHFIQGLGGELLQSTLSSLDTAKRLSLYIHIPYCDRLCWFCGCHTKQTNQYAPVVKYVDTLIAEIMLLGEKSSCRPLLGEVHFGGGSPSLLRSEDMIRIRQALGLVFQIDKATQISVEIDPNDHNDDMIYGLKSIGLTRASIGVQDFDPEVQKAINRPQSFEQTFDLVRALRSIGISSVNVDALYGLPLQNKQRLQKTIERVISMEPDRIAMFGYAHVPWVKKHQSMINEGDLPGNIERYEQAKLAEELLVQSGFQKIGLDHYARPDDKLAQCANQGILRRNFQGYTSDPCETLIGLGASSIGQSTEGHFQNIVPTGQYTLAVNNGTLPAAKGYRFTQDDRIRGWIIERLMCDFHLKFDELEARFGSKCETYVEEAIAIAKSDRDGLCTATSTRFQINDDALAFTRLVVAKFDSHLKQSDFKFSKAV